MRKHFKDRLIVVCLATLWMPILDAAGEQDPAAGGLLHTLRKDVAVEKLGVSESYQESVELEKEIAQLYREIRAARLSRIQRQSLKMSLRQTLIPLSDRPAPNTGVLDSNATNGDDISRYQDALQKLMQENDAIVANAEEMLLSLQPEPREKDPAEEQDEAPEEQAPEDAAEQHITEMMANADQQMEAAAASLDTALSEMRQADSKLTEILDTAPHDQSGNGKASELQPKLNAAKDRISSAIDSISSSRHDAGDTLEQARDATRRIEEALTASIDLDGDLQQQKQSQPQKHTGGAVEALKKAQQQMAAAQDAAIAEKGNRAGGQNQEIAKQQILEALARAEAGTYLDLTAQMKGQGLTNPPGQLSREELPPPVSKTFKGVSGRTFVTQGGTPAVWSHVNKWYIMGPYDNRGRMNLQRVYPPQSIIDLDASYPGKDGALLTWAYDSFVNAMVNPSTGRGEYTIYYGFTEVFFEQETNTWIAVGSDDRSDLWINDMPVWHSSDKLKIWNIGEGYRKVHFKKGRNKLVFRLENGWQDLGFSLLINSPESHSTPPSR